MSRQTAIKEDVELTNLVERVARRIAKRIYSCSWDRLPESGRRAAQILARQSVTDVTAELGTWEP